MKDGSITYDMAGEVLTDTQTVPGLAPAVILSDGYTNGNRTSLSANLGGTVNQATSAVTGGTADFLNNYSYTASATNPYGQMSQVSQTANGGNTVAAKTATFQYDLQGELTVVGRYQNANATANLVTQATYGRDNDGNLTSLVYANAGSTLPNYSWTYDSLGDMATASETLGSIVNSVSYTSDSTGQLLTATGGPSAETFFYDTNGNRTSATTGTSTATYTTGPNNEILCDGTNSYAFDAQGNWISQTNLSTGAQIQYAWDNRNRLVEVTFVNGSGTVTQTVNYTYDAFNRWIGETVTTYSGQTSTTTQTRFAYDGSQIVTQFDGAGTSALTAANLSHRYLWGPAVDQLLADEQVTNGDLVVWALGDNQNTVRDLATYSNGVTTVVNHRVFSAYGQEESQTNPATNTAAAVECLFAYTGEPLSVFSVNTTTGAETGLQNNDNRWYNAIIGRWLSQDPSGFGSGDANLYRYCGNGPANGTDPSGLQSFQSPAMASGLIKSGDANNIVVPATPAVPGGDGPLAAAQAEAMRNALTASIANLPAAQQARAKADLERLIQIAGTTKGHPLTRVDDCVKWNWKVSDKYNETKDDIIRIQFAGWEYPIPSWRGWVTHQAIKVILPDGTSFYLDDGWWEGDFTEDRPPSRVTRKF
jgi:RHS repeat-associated protein